jgi:WD40 repeat protein
LEQGDTVLVARGHQGWVWSAVFDGDGKRIVTAAEDGIARVWRITGQGEPVVLKGHRGLVLRARFSHDGRLVATAGLDSTARVYRLDQHGAEMVLPDHDGAVRDAVFLPDDSRLVTISDDGTARVWRVSWRALHAYLQLATSACLTREQRIALLGEGAAKATDRFRRCEHDHGRLSRL